MDVYEWWYLLKSLEPLLNSASNVDLYFVFDEDRYISTKFCVFWLELLDHIEKYKSYNRIPEEIDKNMGRDLLTDMVEETKYQFEILPRLQINPYTLCDTEFNKKLISYSY